ncbi:hypothetical protein EI546_03880 [Aequorivita sp. H23M31]|uniref:Uncharacterized protein n=1 Tax=Aequorivita ciconiae TaxID=2494375 RepID=A0A410G118_9FLAO|nr:hypothetical protein [Aequorivita sp. H23M31]QAA80920.1 hypothetical protein EI546_03880 [Aequorivita sp. H23M31]
METENTNSAQQETSGQYVNISEEKLMSLVNLGYGNSGDTPNPEEPHKPGPWDPILRQICNRYFGPSPQPWRSESHLSDFLWNILAERIPALYDTIYWGRLDWAALNPQPLPPKSIFADRFNWASLNPQPLPPKSAVIVEFTEQVLDRIFLMQEIGDGLNRTGQEQGIIIVSGKLDELVDELCPRPYKFPFPGPKRDLENGLPGLDLLRAAKVIRNRAEICSNNQLKEELLHAGRKLMEVGIDRLEYK